MLRRLGTLGVMVLVGMSALLVCRMVRAQITADLYRHRLHALSHDYGKLRSTYNDAVGKTAVTELLVEDGRLFVAVRTVEGVQRVIPTPFDPAREIFVDFVVADGRLWIRRVFDDLTSPQQGLVIDPSRDEIDWNAPGVAHGKAVYRSLDEGWWVITVSGDGSLGLARREGHQVGKFASAPPVRDYPQIDREVAAEVDQITLGDMVRFFVSP